MAILRRQSFCPAHQQTWPVDTRVSVTILAIDADRQRFSVKTA
jgi:hypothetical protein